MVMAKSANYTTRANFDQCPDRMLLWILILKHLFLKSVRLVPGNEFIQIYDGKMTVVNFLINVQLKVDGREMNMKRLEVFHKTASS